MIVANNTVRNFLWTLWATIFFFFCHDMHATEKNIYYLQGPVPGKFISTDEQLIEGNICFLNNGQLGVSLPDGRHLTPEMRRCWDCRARLCKHCGVTLTNCPQCGVEIAPWKLATGDQIVSKDIENSELVCIGNHCQGKFTVATAGSHSKEHVSDPEQLSHSVDATRSGKKAASKKQRKRPLDTEVVAGEPVSIPMTLSSDCPECPLSWSTTPVSERVKTHVLNCPKRKKLCRNCNSLISAADDARHQVQCPMVLQRKKIAANPHWGNVKDDVVSQLNNLQEQLNKHDDQFAVANELTVLMEQCIQKIEDKLSSKRESLTEPDTSVNRFNDDEINTLKDMAGMLSAEVINNLKLLVQKEQEKNRQRAAEAAHVVIDVEPQVSISSEAMSEIMPETIKVTDDLSLKLLLSGTYSENSSKQDKVFSLFGSDQDTQGICVLVKVPAEPDDLVQPTTAFVLSSPDTEGGQNEYKLFASLQKKGVGFIVKLHCEGNNKLSDNFYSRYFHEMGFLKKDGVIATYLEGDDFIPIEPENDSKTDEVDGGDIQPGRIPLEKKPFIHSFHGLLSDLEEGNNGREELYTLDEDGTKFLLLVFKLRKAAFHMPAAVD